MGMLLLTGIVRCVRGPIRMYYLLAYALIRAIMRTSVTWHHCFVQLLNLSKASLTGDDLVLVGAWMHHCREFLRVVELGRNPDLTGEFVDATAKSEQPQRIKLESALCVQRFRALCGAIRSTHVASYLFSNIGLGPTSTRVLLEELFDDRNMKVRTLDVSFNKLGPGGKHSVAIMIGRAPNLQKLVVDLGHSTARELNKTSQNSKCDLRDCGLELGDAWVAAAWVELCSATLDFIDLSDNPSMINDTEIKSLAQSSNSNVVPQRCQEDPWSYLCMALLGTERVRSLCLGRTGAGPKCAKVLAFALTASMENKFGQHRAPLATRITYLDISGNPLCESLQGLEALVGPDGAIQGRCDIHGAQFIRSTICV